LLLTQVLGGVIAIVVIVFAMLLNPEMAALGEMHDPGEMMRLPVFQFAIGLGLWLAHFLMILLSLLGLRVVPGPSWHREVAVRRPSLAHVGLVVALVPAFFLLANGAYALTEKIGIPSANNLFPAAAFIGAICMALFVLGMGNLFFCVTIGFDWSERLWA